MSQDDLYEIIKANPGISQSELKKCVDLNPCTVCEQTQRLEKWGKVWRVRNGFTFKLYPTEGT